jgi:hypothetical protein
MEPLDPTVRPADGLDVAVDVELRSLFAEALAVQQQIADWDGDEPGQAELEARLTRIEARIETLEAHARNARKQGS